MLRFKKIEGALQTLGAEWGVGCDRVGNHWMKQPGDGRHIGRQGKDRMLGDTEDTAGARGAAPREGLARCDWHAALPGLSWAVWGGGRRAHGVVEGGSLAFADAQAWGGMGRGAGSRERRLQRQAEAHDGFHTPRLYFILETLGSYQTAYGLGSGFLVRDVLVVAVKTGWSRAGLTEPARGLH